MKRQMERSWAFAGLLGLAVASISFLGLSARAQDAGNDGYATREDGSQTSAIGHGNAEEGPVRLARFSYVQGNVTWRPDDGAEWSSATVNLPLRQGAQIWVADAGRAEIQLDDGSLLRLGKNAVATLQTLYSDSAGEFTEIKLTAGLASLRLKHDHSIFQVDTPIVSVKATGPAALRVGADDGVEVGVRSGAATIEGARGKATLQSGDYLDLASADDPYNVRGLPGEDSWEQWNDARDDRLAGSSRDSEAHHLPPNIAIVATELDSSGDWRDDPQYGWVWCPRTTVAAWRPYQYGHWTWVNPFGWTWVSDESWGWAPYHYGTWCHISRGWAWAPGPEVQCWSPAVVHFTECDGRVAWCPLAPGEVRYGSSIGFGVRGREWSAYFSIGRAAVYYPSAAGYCEPRVFNNTVVNRVTVINNVTNNYNGPSAAGRFRGSSEYFAANSNTVLNNRFVPVNSRVASGVTATNAAEFGGRARYEPVDQSASSLFQRGRGVGAPEAGRAPSAGPAGVRPTVQALTPSRTYLPQSRPDPRLAEKPIYRASLPAAIERTGAPVRTLPTSQVGARTSIGREPLQNDRHTLQGNRNPLQSDRNTLPGNRDPQRTNGADATRPNTGRPSSGNTGRDDSASNLTPAQIRARDARRSLGYGDSTRGNGAGSGQGSNAGGQDSTTSRRRDPSTATGSQAGGNGGTGRFNGDDTRRQYPGGEYRRLPTGTPPPDGRRSDTTPSYGGSRGSQGSGADTGRRAPPAQAPAQPPTRTPVPSAPPAAPRRTAPPSEPRRTPPPTGGQGKDTSKPSGGSSSDKKGSDGSSSPGTGRGRGN